MSFSPQQPPSAGKTMTFGAPVEQGGVMQPRLLQENQQLNQPPTAGSPWRNAVAQAAQQAITPSNGGGGGGWQPMAPTQDPNVAATMQGLQGLLADSKQKKMDFAKALLGG